MTDYIKIPETLRALTERAGLEADTIAKKEKVTPTSIYRREHHGANVRRETIETQLAVLKASVKDFCIELAANMLGLEPVDEAAERAALDALGELLNVICGVLIEAWQGPDSTLRMGVPEVRQTNAESFLGQSSESLLVAIRTDDGRLVAMGARLDDESGAC